ncbi:hypothetical protein EYF80_030064 [Liparis tanakae]|uniref:Uncharacterized protein n=1 Tax=Liparis tanakae TaxID=230148 RepID=A0A4Z2H3L7_9TELE|nr:hypothetical protein EYF80_030064 [Liparis tanakae]
MKTTARATEDKVGSGPVHCGGWFGDFSEPTLTFKCHLQGQEDMLTALDLGGIVRNERGTQEEITRAHSTVAWRRYREPKRKHPDRGDERRREEARGDERRREEARGDERRREETRGGERRREEARGDERRREEARGDERRREEAHPAVE